MQVEISGNVLVPVPDENIVTVSTGVARLDYASIPSGINRSASGGSIIGSSMWAHCLVDRVQAAHVKV